MENCVRLKDIAKEEIEKCSSELLKVSQTIWSNPEIAYQEKDAHEFLSNFLEEKGFHVTRHYTLDTAFRGNYGHTGVNVGIICEFDALPGIGHGCGHNLIAEAGVGAALGIKAALEATEENLGKVVVLGTPAEEGGGGKIRMIDNGCFDDLDFCLMVHPKPLSCIYANNLACEHVHITYTGHAAHAAAFPWEGINALDAAVCAYNNVSALRQQMKPTWRVHGVFTEAGVKPNIIPERASLHFQTRAPNAVELNVLHNKMQACFDAAALATGCKASVEWDPDSQYLDVWTNETLARLYQKHAEDLGLTFLSRAEQEKIPFGSTDMGNVSQMKPAIHPYFDIGTKVANHTPEFTQAAATEEAHRRTLLQAKTMAMVALDVMCNKNTLRAVKDDFNNTASKKKQQGQI